jgi:predicted ABC-type ATPase
MNIYIIAGPPGIGKSSSSFDYVPDGIPIIDQDLAAYQYKKDGFQDYQQLATFGVNQTVKNHLFEKKDFVLELNLGFQSHYDYLKSIAYFNSDNQVHLILYFTNNIELCLLRAEIRHRNGGHLVTPEIIKEMYENTFPLFRENVTLFQTIKFLDVSDTSIIEVTSKNIPNWLKNNNLTQYLER